MESDQVGAFYLFLNFTKHPIGTYHEIQFSQAFLTIRYMSTDFFSICHFTLLKVFFSTLVKSIVASDNAEKTLCFRDVISLTQTRL